MNRRFAFVIALAGGLVAGVAYPLVDVAIACRAPASEACVWAKAYLPLTIVVSLVVGGGFVTALLYVVLSWIGRRAQFRDQR